MDKHYVMTYRKKAKALLTFLIVICILLLTACSEKTDKNNKNSSVSGGSSQNSTSSGSSQSEDTSSDDTTVSNSDVKKELRETFNVTDNISNSGDGNAATELIGDIPANCANLSNPITGFCDTEADKMRNNILNTRNTEEVYKITGTKYYVSGKGNDDNSGMSADKPLKTVDAIDKINLKVGDAVLFERGYVFRITRPINVVEGVTYGAYGKGAKPVICGSPGNYANASLWKPTKKKNVWQLDFSYPEAACLIFDYGKEIGYARRMGLQQLIYNGEFYHNNDYGYFFLYCDKGNPGKIYKSIEISTQGSLFYVDAPNVTIDNLCLKYSGNFAVNGRPNVDNINITNCEMGYIGGADYNTGNSRYGNAIQFWQGCTNINVSNNWIYQTFDTAITWQGKGTKKEFAVYKNIYFNNNLLEYNNCDYELWDSEYSSIENFTMKDNIMRFTSMGWGTRPNDFGIRGIEGPILATLEPMQIKSFLIKDNIIDTPGREIIKLKYTQSQAPQFTITGNKVYVNSAYRGTELVTVYSENRFNAKNQSDLEKAFSQFGRDTVVLWK